MGCAMGRLRGALRDKGMTMKRFSQLSLMVVAMAGLSACGGAKEEPAPADTTAAAPAATTPAPAAAAAPTADSTDTVDGTTLAAFTGDAAKGEKIFLQCKSCHALEAGKNGIGPSLAGIVGRAASTVEGYKYSDANMKSGITWSKEKLFQYLENPQRVVPGTKMAFAGLPQAQDRADVIAYLEANAK